MNFANSIHIFSTPDVRRKSESKGMKISDKISTLKWHENRSVGETTTLISMVIKLRPSKNGKTRKIGFHTYISLENTVLISFRHKNQKYILVDSFFKQFEWKLQLVREISSFFQRVLLRLRGFTFIQIKIPFWYHLLKKQKYILIVSFFMIP